MAPEEEIEKTPMSNVGEHVQMPNIPGLRVGVDICSVARIIEVHSKYGERFLNRILTKDEIEYVTSSNHHFYTRIAARFAAKEAAVKVLGTGWIGVGWQEVEVKRERSGEPRISLSGRAAARAEQLGLTRFELSMTHEREFAVAFLVAY